MPVEDIFDLWLRPALATGPFADPAALQALQGDHSTPAALKRCLGNDGPFANLVTLRLGLTLGLGPKLWFDEPWPEHQEERPEDVTNFLNFFYVSLQNAVYIQTLGLTILPHAQDDEYLGQDVFKTITVLNEEVLTKLSTLELDGHRIDRAHLLGFLDAKKSTLRRVNLRYIKCPELSGEVKGYVRPDDSPETSIIWREIVENWLPKCDVTWHRVYDGRRWADRELSSLACI